MQTLSRLSSSGAEHVIEEIVNCLTLQTDNNRYCNSDDGELTVKVTHSDLALIKKLNGVTYTYNLAFGNPESFKQELVGVLGIMKLYPNIERIRYAMINFMNREFGNCSCHNMDAKKMEMIVLNAYYNLNYYPLPPHHACIGDIIQRSLRDQV